MLQVARDILNIFDLNLWLQGHSRYPELSLKSTHHGQ